MNKSITGLIFISAGLIYGSLVVDGWYNLTLGWLVEHNWIKQPLIDKKGPAELFGRKPTILLYASILIIIGVFILWNRNN